MLVDVLVPDNVPTVTFINVSIIGGGSGGGPALLVNGINWISGTLGAYLVAAGDGSLVTPNIKPTNPINAFLPATLSLDPGATGFHVYEYTLRPADARAGRLAAGAGGDLQRRYARSGVCLE
jgi:hypothetical protein